MKVQLQIIPYDFDEQALGERPCFHDLEWSSFDHQDEQSGCGNPFDKRLQIPIV